MEKTEIKTKKGSLKEVLSIGKILNNSVFYSVWPIFMVSCIIFLELTKHFTVMISNLTGIFAISVVGTSLKNGKQSGIIMATVSVSYTYYYLFLSSISFLNKNSRISYMIIHILIIYGLPFMVGELNKKLIESNNELQKNKNRLERTQEFSYVMVVYSDLVGRIKKMPEGFCKLLGYTEEELLKLRFKDITHPAGREKEVSQIQDVLLGKYKSFEIEKRLIKKNGEPIWVYVNISLMVDDKGKPTGFMSYVKDINLYKKAVLELRENEEKLRRITECMTDMICQVNENGIVEYVSPSFKKVMGYSQEELLYTAIFDKVHPDNLDYTKEAFSRTLEKCGPGKIEAKVRNKNGQYIWLEIVGDVFYDYNKQIKGAIFSSREITARKSAEKALSESEKRYRLLAENSPYAIAVHREGIILYANKAAAQLIGYRHSEELIGRSVLDFSHKEYRQSVANRMEEVYKGKTAPLIEEKLVKTNGDIIDVEVVAIPFDCQGNPAVQVVVKDITDRKRAERLQQNIQKQQLELNKAHEYDKIKTEFFANISHELRTPLNVILGSLQLFRLYLQDEYILDKNPNILKHTNVMKQNCFRLLRLVNNIIDSTKIDSGFYELRLQDYDAVEMVKNISESVASYIESKDIKLEFSSNLNKLIVAVDPDKIERVLLNLLSNSVKFTPAGGKIIVNVDKCENQLKITVADTGIGIPQDKIADLFQRFHQVDKSLTRNHEGSGIGLSLVQSLVSMHGGSITVSSEHNIGSEFIINIPIRRINKVEPIEEDYLKSSSRVERIHVEFSDIYS